jgi:hypothetical protein
MRELLLEFHGWRTAKADDDSDLVALFLFSLMPAERRRGGAAPRHEDCFWTEVRLSRFLAEQPGWRSLSQEEKLKAMFQNAVESVKTAGRKLRQAPMFWTATSPLRDGPPWDLAKVEFPRMSPVSVDADAGREVRLAARKAAGLLQ